MKKTILLFFISSLIFGQGTLLWKVTGENLPAEGYSWSSPLILDGKLIWTGQDKGMAAIDAETGDILWTDTTILPLGTYDDPVGINGIVIISKSDYSNDSNSCVLAFDAASGNVLWQVCNVKHVNRSAKPISIKNNSVYFASTDTLWSMNVETGEVNWKKGGKYGNLLINCDDTYLIAARSDTGMIEKLELSSGLIDTFLVMSESEMTIGSMAAAKFEGSEHLVIAPERDWNRDEFIFYCLDIDKDSLLWSSSSMGYVGNRAAPVISNGVVFAGVEKYPNASAQYIVAFDLQTGFIKWEFPARSSGATNTPYVIALDNKVFFESSVNEINAGVAYDPVASDTLWTTQPRFENPWPLTWGSPLIYKNKLYLSKDGEGVFCYDAGIVEGEWTMANGNVLATNSFVSELSTDVQSENSNMFPANFELHQNYPNPFNPETIIEYSISAYGFNNYGNNVTLKVYDVLGCEVAVLVNQHQNPGNYRISFDGSSLATGIYLYKLSAGNFSMEKKMLLVK